MPTSDTFVSDSGSLGNRIRECRVARGWSQQELATRSGLSRPAISAIEIGRIVPAVTAALRLAGVFGCPVEELFGIPRSTGGPSFVWDARNNDDGWWIAEVGGELRLFPFEGLEDFATPIDGRGVAPVSVDRDLLAKARQTLVIAGCDPAVGFLARQLAARGVRVLALRRSSNEALALLRDGKIHLAGIHLGHGSGKATNAQAAAGVLGFACQLIRYVEWDEGLIGGNHVALSRPKTLFRQKLRWLGRESGSGIGHMLADFFEDRPLPRRTVPSHRAVATAVQAGLADIGPALRIIAAETGLQFLPLRRALYDLCLNDRDLADPRIESLLAILRGNVLRTQLADLPGYLPTSMGEIEIPTGQ